MEPTHQTPEILISSPRSSSFLDRIMRRTPSSSGPQSPPLHSSSSSQTTIQPLLPTLSIPQEPPTRRSRSRSSSRKILSQESSTKTHLTIDTKLASRSRSRSRSRSSTSRSRSRSPNPSSEIYNQEEGPTNYRILSTTQQRVASINHVGRHTNDWLFGGFHLTGKIGTGKGGRK